MAYRRGVRDQESHNDFCELIDNLPESEQDEVLSMIFERYGHRMGGGEDRRRRARDEQGLGRS
jgi:hypothetical protein